MNTVILRLGAGATVESSWVRTGVVTTMNKGTLAEAALACVDSSLIVLVPATDVLLINAVVPGRNEKRAIQALPFVLEESLAADVEELHFAVGTRNPDGSMDTAVVSKKCMENWLAILHEAGLRPDYMTPETLAVPYDANGIAVLLDQGVAMVRTGLRAGFAVDAVNLRDALASEKKADSDSTPQHLQVYQEGEVEADLAFDREVLPVITKSPLAVLGQGFDKKIGINLLQGEYGRNTDWYKILDILRVPLILLMVLISIKTVLFGVEFSQVKSESMALERRIEQIYRETFPEAKQVVNPRVQMEQRLAQLDGGNKSNNSFLEILARFGPYLQKTKGYKLQHLRYHGNVVELELNLENLEGLNDLKERLLSNNDLSVDIRTARADNDRISARMEIRGK